MRKILTALFLLLATPALAQWQVATGYIPKGRGPGVIGFGQSLIYDGGTGCVGIGTTSCTERFTVAGSRAYVQANRATAAGGQVGYQLTTGGTPGWFMYQPVSSTDLRFYDGSNDRLTLYTGGGGYLSVGSNYNTLVKDVPYTVNLPIYNSGFSTQIATNSIFDVPGNHPTYARNSLAVGMYALGSGVNGPTTSDVAIQASCVKQNWGDGVTTSYGEGECVSLFGRWGGPPGAGAGNFANNSDFALILGDGAIAGTAGVAFFAESSMRAVNYNAAGGATTLQQQMQLNGVNPRDGDGGLGIYFAASVGTFENGLLIGSTNSTAKYNNLIKAFNSLLGDQYLLDQNGEQWLYPFNLGASPQAIRVRNDLAAGRFSVATAAGTNRFTVDGVTGNTIATGYVSGTSLYLGANLLANSTGSFHQFFDSNGFIGFSIGNGSGAASSKNFSDNTYTVFRARQATATFADISSAGIGVYGSTSGTATIAAQAVAGTPTLTLPNTSGTFAVSASSPLTLNATTGALTCTTCALTSGTLAQFAATTSAQLLGVISDETGTGSLVFATSPVLVTPNLGTPSAATLTNATGLPISTGVSGLGTGITTFLGTPTSANLAAAVTNETGSGLLVFATSPTLTTPVISSIVNTGTLTLPTSTDTLVGKATTDTFTNKTFDTAGTGNSFSINGVAATANTGTGAVARATSPTFVTPVLGTPTSGTLTNATGLPISTGVSGLATGIATFLGTSTSANLASAVTDETGSGALVFATSPTLVTPTLGAASGTSLSLSTPLGFASGGNNDSGTAASTYTPTLSCGSGTLTTSSAAGRQKQLASKIYWVQMVLTITTNGTCAGTLNATLPATANSAAIVPGRASNGPMVQGFGSAASNTISIVDYGSNYPAISGSTITMTGVFEAQ